MNRHTVSRSLACVVLLGVATVTTGTTSTVEAKTHLVGPAVTQASATGRVCLPHACERPPRDWL